MTRFNINKRDGFNLEATCLGWDIKFDDRKGKKYSYRISLLSLSIRGDGESGIHGLQVFEQGGFGNLYSRIHTNCRSSL